MSGPAGNFAVAAQCRYFVTYTGIEMPFRLVGPIDEGQVGNRNTFIRAWYDADGRLVGFDKLVYGEVELAHRYGYHDNGSLAWAEIEMCDEDKVTMLFDESGAKLSTVAHDT